MYINEAPLISTIRSTLLDIHPLFQRYSDADIQQWIRDSFDAYVLLRPDQCTRPVLFELAPLYRAVHRVYNIFYTPVTPEVPTAHGVDITNVEVLAINSVVALHATTDTSVNSTVPYKVTIEDLSAADHTWPDAVSTESGFRQAGVMKTARNTFFISPRGYYHYATLEVVLRPYRYDNPATEVEYHFVDTFIAPAIVHHSVFLALLQDGSSQYNNQKAQEFYQLFLAAVTGEGPKE